MYDPSYFPDPGRLSTQGNIQADTSATRSASPRTLRELALADQYTAPHASAYQNDNQQPISSQTADGYTNQQWPQTIEDSNFQSVYMGNSVYGDTNQFADTNMQNQIGNANQGMNQLIIDAQYMYSSESQSSSYNPNVQSSQGTDNAVPPSMFSTERSVTPTNAINGNAGLNNLSANAQVGNLPAAAAYQTNDFGFNGQYGGASGFMAQEPAVGGIQNQSSLDALSNTITASSNQSFGEAQSEERSMLHTTPIDSYNPDSSSSGSTSAKEDTLTLKDDDRHRMWSFDNESSEHANVLETSQLERPTLIPPDKMENEDIAAMWVWKPSVATAINRFMTSPVNTSLERDQITTPGIIESAQGDPLQDLLSKYTKNIRNLCKSSMLSADEEGLQVLMVNENFRAALELTDKILTGFNQGRGMASHMSKHTVQSIRIWHARIIILTKLKMFSAAESELDFFGEFEKADLCFEYYPHLYRGKSGSIVPFCLRLLWAEMPSYCGKYNESLDRLSRLQSSVSKLMNLLSEGKDHNGHVIDYSEYLKLAIKYWTEKENQVLYSIGNCFLQCMDYSAALETYDRLLRRLCDLPEDKIHLSSAIGRCCLQLGDLKRAAVYFKSVESLTSEVKAASNLSSSGVATMGVNDLMKLDHQVYMNRGLLFVAQNKYKDAMVQFQHIVQDNPKDVVACNNLAVTNVYLGKIKDASTVLDRVMKQSPIKKNTNENLIQNLSILFGNETPKSLGKKILLLEHVAKYKGDAFATSSLRLT